MIDSYDQCCMVWFLIQRRNNGNSEGASDPSPPRTSTAAKRRYRENIIHLIFSRSNCHASNFGDQILHLEARLGVAADFVHPSKVSKLRRHLTKEQLFEHVPCHGQSDVRVGTQVLPGGHARLRCGRRGEVQQPFFLDISRVLVNESNANLSATKRQKVKKLYLAPQYKTHYLCINPFHKIFVPASREKCTKVKRIQLYSKARRLEHSQWQVVQNGILEQNQPSIVQLIHRVDGAERVSELFTGARVDDVTDGVFAALRISGPESEIRNLLHVDRYLLSGSRALVCPKVHTNRSLKTDLGEPASSSLVGTAVDRAVGRREVGHQRGHVPSVQDIKQRLREQRVIHARSGDGKYAVNLDVILGALL